MTAVRTNDCTTPAAVLYMAFELGEGKWKLGFTTGLGQKAREREVVARAMVCVEQEIAAAKERFGLPADTTVVACYEAGRDGFWLHRCLLSRGVQNAIVDSSSIRVDRRQRRAKTDRLDLRELLKMLVRWHLGERDVWRVVHVPTAAEEDARQLQRELETLRAEQTGHTNRIKGLLVTCGVTLTVDRHFPRRLKELRLWDGSALPRDLHHRLLREFERMQVVNRQVRELEKERAQRMRKEETDVGVVQARQLLRLKGIGINSAYLYTREFFAWRKIRNRREVGALAGLTGSPYRSGMLDHEQGISKAGNRRVRALAIEIAWGWLFYQPQSVLSLWYERRFAHGGKRLRRIGIVALARKLLVALWRYLESGVPPLGAARMGWEKKIYDNTPSLQAS
jgi:transposase